MHSLENLDPEELYICHMGGRISPYSLQDDIAERLHIRVILSNSHIFSNLLSN